MTRVRVGRDQRPSRQRSPTGNLGLGDPSHGGRRDGLSHRRDTPPYRVRVSESVAWSVSESVGQSASESAPGPKPSDTERRPSAGAADAAGGLPGCRTSSTSRRRPSRFSSTGSGGLPAHGGPVDLVRVSACEPLLCVIL